MHYYSFNIADFALSTSHLSLEEEAVYRRLLDYYYKNESPVPKETQPVIRRLRLVNHSDIVASILDEFFVLEDDGYHNLRADIEIADYKNKAEKARQNGKKGGRPPKSKGPKTQPVILANPEKTESKANQEPITNNHKPITNVPPKSPKGGGVEWEDDYIDLFWSSYVKKVDKIESIKILRKMIRANPDKNYFQMILNRVKEKAAVTEKKYWPSPKRYLQKELWNDEIIDYKGESYENQIDSGNSEQRECFAERQKRHAEMLMARLAQSESDKTSDPVIHEDGSIVRG